MFKMADAEQRPESKMYGGNIDLVSRRENVQVVACAFLLASCFLSKANFFVHISLEDGQGKVSIRIVDFREMTGTADIFICPV